MLVKRSSPICLAATLLLSFLFVITVATRAPGEDLRVEVTKEKGRGQDCQYRRSSSGPYTDWGNFHNVLTFTTCNWIKVLNKNGELKVKCLCGGPNCGCKEYTLKRGKFHIPSKCAYWPGGGVRQDGATLYDVYEGHIETRGGAGCGGGMPGCIAPQVGFNSPVAQACGEWSEPPGLTSWFTADYDSLLLQCRILNHPESAMPMLSRSVSGPDTMTVTSIFPGEGLIYDETGPQIAQVGVFVEENPEGRPGEWVPVQFEVVNTGIVSADFEVYIDNNLDWPLTEEYYAFSLEVGESFFAGTEVFIPEETTLNTYCVVTAEASTGEDLHENTSIVSVIPDVSIEVIPEHRNVHHGENLWLDVDITNNTDAPQEIGCMTTVLLPQGVPYQGNPLIGPYIITIAPYQTLSFWAYHTIPGIAPYGMYVYEGYVGIPSPRSLLDQSGFGFNVIE